MAIQGTIKTRTGLEADFDPYKMIAGEWAVSTDMKYVRMCFAPGVCFRMATYEAFEEDMDQIRAILAEVRTIEEAVERIQSEINDSEIVVEQYAVMSKSYAVGGTGSRDDEDTDNAKYYYEQSKRIAQGVNGIVPMGTITFEELPTVDIVNNAMYNISNAFTSDDRFNDGGGVYYGAGNNVLWTANGKWDVTASSGVTGFKGSNETTYRQGNVSISADNIGLGNVDNTPDAEKPISNPQKEKFDNVDATIGTANISTIGDGTVKGAISSLSESTVINDYLTGVDVLTVTKGGFYYVDAPVNAPEGAAGGYLIVIPHVKSNDAYRTLLWIEYNSVDVKINSCYGKWTGWGGFLPLTGGMLSGNASMEHSNYPRYGITNPSLAMNAVFGLHNDFKGATVGAEKQEDNNDYTVLTVREGTNEKPLVLYRKKGSSAVLGVGEIFGEHNKPSGTYTGNGSITQKNISTGGIGNICSVHCENGFAYVTPRGAIVCDGTSVSVLPSTEAVFNNGVLTMATRSTILNPVSMTCQYQVL